MNGKSHKGTAYADIQALHYLCRPSSLSELCPKEFFEEYEVVGSGARNRTEDLMEFEDTVYYKHPTSAIIANGNTGRLQAIRSRHTKKLAWVGQWNFPNVADFGTDILHCTEITEEMESYSFIVLAFCHHYYSIEDLKLNGSSVAKLRQIYNEGGLKQHEEFLQNVQDSAYNFLRIRPTHDNLQASTEAFVPPDNGKEEEEEPDNQADEEVPFLQGAELDSFMDSFELNLDEGEYNETPDTFDSNFTPETLNLNRIRKKGLSSVAVINYVRLLLTSAKMKTMVVSSQLPYPVTRYL
jgi:hypothetical protein